LFSLKDFTMFHGLSTVTFALAASISWGAGDFSGGLATRRAQVLSVVCGAYAVGLIMLMSLAMLWSEPFPSTLDLLWGSVAGVVGAIGLVAFYQALSIGRMGIVAPIAAMLSAAVPVLFGAFIEGLPGPIQLIGFVLAFIAVGLISGLGVVRGRPKGLGLALLAGLGFGSFFILISRVSQGAVFWPLAAARLSSFLFLFAILLIRRQKVIPAKSVWPVIFLAGALDGAGNVFFVLATHAGRLDVAAILASLYPAVTVLLATIILKERVTRLQAIGIVVALVAIPLIAA
jgi:drug/metabolite transporter (DMT)-like permease